MDHTVDSSVLLEAEIEALMFRLAEQDPDAILRLERLLARVRTHQVVEIPIH